MKVCSKCQIEKDESEFDKHKNMNDGLQPRCRECRKQYRKENKEKLNEKAKQYYRDNIENKKEYDRQYRKDNKEKRREQNNLYVKKRKQIDIYFKFRRIISTRIYQIFKKEGAIKDDSCLEKLGYTMKQLYKHLKSCPTWEPWMTIKTHGSISVIRRTWQIDHIIPQSKLLYDSMDHPNFKKCWALENLQPLEAFANIRKGNKIL